MAPTEEQHRQSVALKFGAAAGSGLQYGIQGITGFQD